MGVAGSEVYEFLATHFLPSSECWAKAGATRTSSRPIIAIFLSAILGSTRLGVI